MGISGESDAVDYDVEIFRKIVDINVTGTFLVCQAVGREMHSADVTGSVVIIASMSGWVTNRVSSIIPFPLFGFQLSSEI